MIKKLGNLLDMDEYDINSVLQGSSYAIFSAKNDQEKYDKYKKGEIDELSDYQIKEMQIISLLENLGYPMDQLGTYLYKEVIHSAYDEIKDYSSRNDMTKARELMQSLQDAYSNFYHWIARDDMEMGITSFHLYIERAINEIDEDKIKPELAIKVFGNNPEETNYGIQAFRLASYIAKKYSMKYEKPKVKTLSNIPKNVKLKGEYV